MTRPSAEFSFYFRFDFLRASIIDHPQSHDSSIVIAKARDALAMYAPLSTLASDGLFKGPELAPSPASTISHHKFERNPPFTSNSNSHPPNMSMTTTPTTVSPITSEASAPALAIVTFTQKRPSTQKLLSIAETLNFDIDSVGKGTSTYLRGPVHCTDAP